MGGCLTKLDRSKVSPLNPKQKTEKTSENDESESIGLATDRSCTDLSFLILLIVFLIVLFVLLGYCISFGDIYRIVNGYDDCGNVCGKLNTFVDEQSGCRGFDYQEQKYLKVQSSGTTEVDNGQISRICVKTCDGIAGYKKFINRCLPEKSSYQINSFFSKTGISEFFQEVSEDLQMCWSEILYLCLAAFVFAVLIMFMFRFIVGFIVWLVLAGVIIICFIGTIVLWVTFSSEKSIGYTDTINIRRTNSFLAFAIIATIATIILCLVVLVLRKRIQLVIALFKEAGKALSTMPLLLLEPILTFIALVVVVGLWIYLAIWIESSGELKIENNTSAKYVKNATMKVTRWYNLLALFWMTQFVIGCQHIVIAGAVATWFFTRNKNDLHSPIAVSFSNLVKYHLGTVALGSIIIAMIQLLRALLKWVEVITRDPQNRVTQSLYCCCQCCLSMFENILQFLTRNAYVETALFGYSFCTAGRKAFKILSSNALRVFAINSVGDFVLLLGKAFVVAITVLIGICVIQNMNGVHHSWVILVLIGLFAYLVSHCFISVYEMTIDTIFICFCEDCELNDGISKPYYMSRGLMEFVQNSKRSMDQNTTRSNKAWSTTAATPREIKTISGASKH
ncbi:Choline transporter-like protein 1 [Pseudolycoriella hygida]|uniref:Choline transporter-like protein n=1 Tax=Pseudolycoriella hygida TaxID=35572 RepID=A0A9Q0N8R3_9DIPT|nr:Choline transporter-like protein 1 [Pseudolycoriella hygida]